LYSLWALSFRFSKWSPEMSSCFTHVQAAAQRVVSKGPVVKSLEPRKVSYDTINYWGYQRYADCTYRTLTVFGDAHGRILDLNI
jgi:hypothetical protein